MAAPKRKRQRFTKADVFFIVICSIGAIILIIALVGARIEESQKRKKEQQLQAKIAADPITLAGIYNAVNKLRADKGASAQTLEPNLTNAAQQKCDDMVNNNYYANDNPTTGKKINSYVIDNKGNLYIGYYGGFMLVGKKDQTATEAAIVGSQSLTTLTDPKYNLIGWAICQPRVITDGTKIIVGMYAEKKEKPSSNTIIQQTPTRTYIPRTTHCSSYFIGDTLHTSCY